VSDAQPLFAQPIERFPGIVEDVDAMVDGFGNHIVDFSLICNSGEMKAAHAQYRTFQAGLAQRTLWRVEVAAVRLNAIS
jgi:hypothetical protein